MTAILAVSDGKRVVMGGDSGIIAEQEIYTIGEPKVSRIGELLVGCCGLLRGSQAVRRMAWPVPGEDLEAWRIEVENAMRDALERVGMVYDCPEIHGKRVHVQTLVGVRGRIYGFDQALTSSLAPGVSVIGSGRRPAYGAIYAARELGASLKDQIRLGLAAAAEYCTGVAAPFTILEASPDQNGPQAGL